MALSTRCDFYTVTTVHNGRKYKFNCYSYKIDSLIGPFNIEANSKNKHTTFTDSDGKDTVIYYEETNEKNYTEISVPTKRIHRSKYENAVKNQLLYFNNIEFKIIDEHGQERVIEINSNIQYNSKRLIISQASRFSKPHIVIVKGDDDGKGTGVCYGYIDFPELEMEQLYGNVGIKCPIRSIIRNDDGSETVLQEGVEVTPSRESVVWSEHTRDFIKKVFTEAVEEASEIVQEQLKETDFIKWLVACRDVVHQAPRNSVLGELKQVIDSENIKPFFNKTKIRFTYPSSMFKGCSLRINRKLYNNKEKRSVIDRVELVSWRSLNLDKVYYKTQRASQVKDSYIESIDGEFITIEKLSDEVLEKIYRNKVDNPKVFLEDNKFQELLDKRDEIISVLLESKYIKDYDAIEVPEDFGKKFEEDEEIAEVARMSAAEKRKLESKIVIHYLCPKNNVAYNSDKLFIWKQKDTKISDIQEDEATIVYGFSADDKMMHFTAMLLRRQMPDISEENKIYYYNEAYNLAYFNSEFKLIKINKTNERHFKGRENCVHVSDFFEKIESING